MFTRWLRPSLCVLPLVLLSLASGAYAQCTPGSTNFTVTVCSPADGSTVTSPVHILASTTSSVQVTVMQVYDNDQLVYQVRSNNIDTNLTMAAGAHHLVVKAWKSGGGNFYTSLHVTVATSSTPAPTIQFSANPTTINAGQSATLSWSTTNATSVNIQPGIGAVNASGTVTVTPAGTTTYQLTATGAGGTQQSSTTVTVQGGSPCAGGAGNPSVGVCSPANGSTVTSPVHVVAGVTSSTPVTAMQIYDNNKLVYQVNANSIDTYLTTTVGSHNLVIKAWESTGGNFYTPVQITVTSSGNPAPTIQFGANPTSISAGQSSTLSWSTSNATSVDIEPGVGTVGPSGSVTVSPAATTTYTATATGAGGTSNSSATVTVQSGSGCTLSTVNPSVTVCSPANGASVTSPVHVVAGSTSSVPVVAMQIYDNDTLVYRNSANSIDTMLTTTLGSHHLVVKAWPSSGSAFSASLQISVTSGTPSPTIQFSANPTSISTGGSSTLTWSTTNATSVDIEPGIGTVGRSGSTTVSPSSTTIYTATATGSGGNTSASTTVTVNGTGGGISSINHVIFMLQENRTFDNYFGMLNPYRQANGFAVGDNGQEFDVDGIDDKLTKFAVPDDEGTKFSLFKLATTCTDDMSSAWLESFGDVNRDDFSTSRAMLLNGFVHTAEDEAKANGYSDTQGKRAMGYYDQDFLNYYYYMASQFALSDRWFSPIASKTIPNRVATMSGGTTQGLVYDPSSDDHLGSLNIESIFQELQNAGVSWKIYYTDTDTNDPFPATTFTYFKYSTNFLYWNPNHAACTGSTEASSAVGDSSNSFCVDPQHVAPLSQYFTDLNNGTLPQFAYIEPGYNDGTDEHPGASILRGQQQGAKIVNALMASSSWKDSVFFLSYDEGGGPFDHVPPVPSHTNDNTDASLNITTDISSIAVNPDGYTPCPLQSGSLHCDLRQYSGYADPGYNSGDAAAQQGFGAQLGFRVPNIVISPFTRKHYVSHVPMDHTAIIKFVENRFIGPSTHLTNRDAAQPNLLDFFDFNAVPWATPPSPPVPSTSGTCNPSNL